MVRSKCIAMLERYSFLSCVSTGDLTRRCLYDGQLWNQNVRPYLAATYTLCINAQHSNSSVGAIYLAVMNQVRFKRDYLLPFVKELQKFETGVLMDVHGCRTKQNVRCILFGVACDLPGAVAF